MTPTSRLIGAATLIAFALACGGGGDAVTDPTDELPGSLAGAVSSFGTRAPIAGAIVQFTAGANVGRVVTTDASGRYEFADLVRGSSLFRVTAGGYDEYTATVVVGASTTQHARLRLPACGTSQATCTTQRASCNESMPMFQRPFQGDFRATNLFDHDTPRQFVDQNGIFRSYCGAGNGSGGIDGHSGYDWLLPAGTPLYAVADGLVRFAGSDPPFFCPPLGRTVQDQQVVVIDHTAPTGEVISSVYVHLSRLDVVALQSVSSGQLIGLSGNTGCSTGPHLHFEVRRAGNSGTRVAADPYGWQGAGRDPWADHAQGAPSVWLWVDAPALMP